MSGSNRVELEPHLLGVRDANIEAGAIPMKAAVLCSFAPALSIEDVPRPELIPGHTLLRVLACGVCRTDLHIFEHDLPTVRDPLIPGHQIVGEVVDGATA
ncbi:MAG TPA: alcohol dehydrogenase catalytic domain-containing protein, partial [Edaphobacter sp.]|nr:alcohol dehydrogenase catalytic domain-containing protein [Edaphobacter sp.]